MAGDPSGEDTLYCQECGEQNLATAQYCQRCGNQLPGLTGGGQENPGQHHTTQGRQQQPQQTQQGQHPQRHGGAQRQPQHQQQPSEEDGVFGGMKSNRRQWILAGIVGTVMIGGVGAAVLQLGNRQHELATEDAVIDEGRDVSGGTITLTGEMELPGGRYLYTELTPQAGYTYDIDFNISASQAIDVYTMPVDQFSRYQDRDDNFSVLTDLSERDITDTTMTTTLRGEGEYRIVFDNTPVFGASPSGEATVEYTMEGSV